MRTWEADQSDTDQTMLVSPPAMSVHANRTTANELIYRRRPRAVPNTHPGIFDTL